LRANLSLEDAAASVERANILTCRAQGDEQSALVFSALLAGSEASIREIEGIQTAISEIGIDNFLANQM
jgi:bacterioferritin (cytochrome b1)